MGMAASQARYLSLVARKTNCEYEGQQINQARTALANQSANLFNQMLGLQVPVPPSTQDFSKTQYSFTDGINPAVIDKWEQLANPDDEGYNYVVEYHYEASVYTGFQKKMNDPQVQFSLHVPTEPDYTSQREIVDKIFAAQTAINTAETNYKKAVATWESDKTKAKQLSTYRDRETFTDCSGKKLKKGDPIPAGAAVGDYVVTKGTTDTIFKTYNNLTDAQKAQADELIKRWNDNGIDVIAANVCYVMNGSNIGDTITLKTDLENLKGVVSGNQSTTLPVYHNTTAAGGAETITSMETTLANDIEAVEATKTALDNAEAEFESLNVPQYIGNTKLNSICEITKEQLAEIKQIMADMEAQGCENNFNKCFESVIAINEDTYVGGIYSFERDGVTYYTTYYDLANASLESDFRNDIDNQPKLNYYHANYVTQNIEKVDKAILDTDSKGRFKSVRFSEDGAQYTLNFETVTDDEAYQDAMNHYYYENAKYDKMVQDLNAKTSIIQQEDRTLELRLKQLDTEQSALSNEIEAVSKVVKDNVEKSFKTFGG